MAVFAWAAAASAQDATPAPPAPARAQEAPAAGPATAAIEYTITPAGLRITEGSSGREVPLPDCEPRALAREGARVYVACGASGLLVLDATDPRNPSVSARAPTDGDAVAVHLVDGRVWVQVARIEARPAAALLRAAAPLQGTASRPLEPSSGPRGAGAPAGEGRPLIAPPRRASLWEVDVGVRPFLPIGNIGFGLLGGAGAAYRFEPPAAVYAELSPAGVAGGKQGTIGTAGAHVLVALDTQLFEVGLGVGGVTLNSPTTDATSSISFAQKARIGARDGLALGYRSNVIVDNDKFALGSADVLLQIPLSQRWWLLLTGGGGPVGYAYGDVGVRYLVHGDLGPGSLLLTGTIGGAGVFKTTRTLTTISQGTYTYYATAKSADYGGPALGVAVEWRL